MRKNNVSAIFTKGYTLSILLHILLLILLGLIFFRPPIIQSWHEFQWISDIESTPEEPMGQVTNASAIASDTPNIGKQQQDANPVAQKATPLPIPSPVIDMPNLESKQSNPKVNINPNNGLSSVINQGVSANSPGGGEYGLSLESGGGDAYFIRQSNPKITPLIDDEVVVEFRLSQSGSVIMNSVTVVSYKQSAHWEALKKEMSYWRFGFKGSYNPQKVYRLRCKFTLN